MNEKNRGSMDTNKCRTCFFGYTKESSLSPCIACEGYNKYVKYDIFAPDTVKISTWDDNDAFEDHGGGSTLDDYPEIKMDLNVNSPKHYMLFPDQGIEVRDVLKALVEKIQKEARKDDWPQAYSEPMFESDYVQMMQYGMRFMEKNGLEDLKKMRWFLDKCIEAYERTNP